MRVRFLFPAYGLLGLVAGLLLSQCFVPTYSDCAFRCGTTTPLCPEQYECRSDGYCHLPDSAAVCSLSDLSVAIDLATDAASAPDAGTD